MHTITVIQEWFVLDFNVVTATLVTPADRLKIVRFLIKNRPVNKVSKTSARNRRKITYTLATLSFEAAKINLATGSQQETTGESVDRYWYYEFESEELSNS